MANIEFVSYEEFPDDPYIKELVFICLDSKYRIAYVRKQAKNGGLYWGVMSAGIIKDNTKKYYDGFMQDSSFLDKDIKTFLENRSWENRIQKPETRKPVDDNLPF